MEISVGCRIRNIRGKESRAAFAQKLGVGTTTLQRYENDERSPELDFLIRLQDITGYSLDYLVYGKESALPSDEVLLLEKYRQASAEIKNKILMLLLDVSSKDATEPVANHFGNNNKGIQIGHNKGGNVANGDIHIKK